jgi:hypothetical protein
MGKWRYSSTILDLGIRWRRVVSFTPRSLYSQRKIPKYPLDRRLCGPQTGLDAVEKRKISYLCRESDPGRPVLNLHYPGSSVCRDWSQNIIVTCHLRSQPIERFVAGQQLRRYATVLETLLGSRPRVAMEVQLEEVFNMWSVTRSYLEDTWGELPVTCCQF